MVGQHSQSCRLFMLYHQASQWCATIRIIYMYFNILVRFNIHCLWYDNFFNDNVIWKMTIKKWTLCMCYKSRLKQNFQEGPKTGPHVASVWSAEVRGLLARFFPHSPSSAVEVTKLIRLIRLAFPTCESQRDTKSLNETFYIGVEQYMASLLIGSPTSLEAQLRCSNRNAYSQGTGVWNESTQSATVTDGSTIYQLLTAVQRWASVPCLQQ